VVSLNISYFWGELDLDRLSVNRKGEYYCGQSIAFDFICKYIEERGCSDIRSAKILVVSDRNVGGYFYSRFEQQFLDKGVRPQLVIVDAGDMYKNLEAVSEVVKAFVDFDFGSGDHVIALGGGGVLDVTSFACSVYNADLKLILVPTTLNAMAEGSVARSAMINSGSHKNVMSEENDICAVFADPDFLRSVPDKVKMNGYAACVRYSVLEDPDLLSEITDYGDLRVFLEKVYNTRAAIERKNPILLTLGNEIADAIQGYFRFMNYSEGEALALGIYSAVPEKIRANLREMYDRTGLPYELKGVSGKMILKVMGDSLRRRYRDGMSMVDLAPDKKSWTVKQVSVAGAMEVLEKRIGVICAD